MNISSTSVVGMGESGKAVAGCGRCWPNNTTNAPGLIGTPAYLPERLSFYIRTRKALLQAVADRITELDIADLSMMSELFTPTDGAATYSGAGGLASCDAIGHRASGPKCCSTGSI